MGALPLLLLAAACTAGQTQASPTTTTATVTTQPPPRPVETTVPSTLPDVDVAAVLGDAIAATGDRYRYASTVEAGDEVLASIEGRVAGSGFDALIDAGDVPVEYRRTDEGEWVRQGEGEWSPLDPGPAPAAPPLLSLAAPIAGALISDEGATVVVDAVFSGTDLGASTEQVTVRITITDGVVRMIGYTTTLGEGAGDTVTVATVISDVGAVEPIPSP